MTSIYAAGQHSVAALSLAPEPSTNTKVKRIFTFVVLLNVVLLLAV